MLITLKSITSLPSGNLIDVHTPSHPQKLARAAITSGELYLKSNSIT
ncbi:hypothetical protein HanRHA438_Chr01g0005641 [Helianthus annuus]|nr:hypothetical protein HanRHA438_Chr01g0005641 [Helianthus annuus]